jgi:type 1 glutamine amidotransferase
MWSLVIKQNKEEAIVKKILLLCDDYWHPGQVVIDGTAPLLEEGFEINVITNARDFSPERLTAYSVVILSKSDEISGENQNSWKSEKVQKSLIEHVENGGGLLAVHSGLVAGEDTKSLDKLIGCRFVSHPEQTIVTVAPLVPHAITCGVEMFQELDEHYRVEILCDDLEILFGAYSPAQGVESEYQTEPYTNSPEYLSLCGYVRKVGKGRVCVLTPGHNLEVWLNESFQKTLKNALLWCAGDH